MAKTRNACVYEGPIMQRLETCVCVCQLNCKIISFEGGPQMAKTRNVCVCEGPKWPRLETCVCMRAP